MAKIECTCQQCGSTFSLERAQINAGGGKYCSRECSSLSQRNRVNCVCLQCGKDFSIQPVQQSRGHGKYCSRECRQLARGKVTRVCPICEKSFKCYRSIEQTYCSLQCAGVARRDEKFGKRGTCAECGKPFLYKSPMYNASPKFCSQECSSKAQCKKVDRVCKVCGKPFRVNLSQVNKGKGFYCSTKCKGIAMSGVNSPLWTGGEYDYGISWYRQRKLARERDGGVCQVCHRKPLKSERQFAIHHIVKARRFHKDWESANALSNLITLCPQCHPKAERGKIAVPVYLF